MLTAACGEPRDKCASEDIPAVREVSDWTLDDLDANAGFNFESSIAVTGLLAAAECTGRREYFARADAWLANNVDVAATPMDVGDAAAGLAFLGAYEEEGNNAYLDTARAIANYLVETHPQIDGGFAYEDDRLRAETPFFTAPFLVAAGVRTGDDRYVDAAITQITLHAERLRDPNTGLMHHAWDRGDDTLHGVLWGRGNGWMAGAAAQVLVRLPEAHDGRGAVETALRDHLDAAITVQSAEGGWHTVLDDPTSYLETSASILLTMAATVATDHGIGDYAGAVAAGQAYVESQVAADGHLQNVSTPTNVSDEPMDYTEKSTEFPAAYAQGLYVMLLTL